VGKVARVIVSGVPHHVTQRGKRRMQTFFSDDDYRAYMAPLAARCAAAEMAA
jgi:putative transposase